MGNASIGPQPCIIERSLSGDEVNVADDNVVCLNIYDLNTDWLRANELLSDVIGIGGAFHAGVEVYGREYVYGSTGITIQCPKTHDLHVYRQSVVMGRTRYSAAQVTEKIEVDMRERWRGEDYEILAHNCCSFSRALCILLVNQQIPPWVDRLAQLATAHGLDSLIDDVMRGESDNRQISNDSWRPESTESCTSRGSVVSTSMGTMFGTTPRMVTPRYGANLLGDPFGGCTNTIRA